MSRITQQNTFSSTDNSNSISYVHYPSLTQASFGSTVNWDISNIQGKILDANVVVNIGTLGGSGIANAALNLPCISNSFNWCTSVTYQNQNNVIQIVPGQAQYIETMKFNSDPDIKFLMTSSGATQIQRFVLSNAVSSTWVIPLRSFINIVKPEVLNSNHSIRVSMILENLSNLVTQIVGTTTLPSCTINSCTLVVKIAKYSNELVMQKNMVLSKSIYRDIFFSNYSQQFISGVGTTTSTVLLSNFSGNVSFLYFTVRPVVSTTRESALVYTSNVASFNIFASTGESISNLIVAPLSQFVINKSQTKSSFAADNAVLSFYHGLDAVKQMETGNPNGYRTYTGSESIQINFTAALAVPMQIDIYGSNLSVFTQTVNGMSKQ